MKQYVTNLSSLCVDKNYDGADILERGGAFLPVSEEEIFAAEKLSKNTFPKELKEFWRSVGEGILYRSLNSEERSLYGGAICSPETIAQLITGTHEFDYYWKDTEQYQDGDIPFYQEGDDSFMIVIDPEGRIVYGNTRIFITDSLQEFFDKYSVDPNFHNP